MEHVNEDLVEKLWIRNDRLQFNEAMGTTTADLDKNMPYIDVITWECATKRIPTPAPFAKALVIALLFWRVKHEMTKTVDQVSRIK